MEQVATTKNELVKSSSTKNAAILGAALMGIILAAGLFFLLVTRGQVYTDKSDLEASGVTITASTGGTLEKMLVKVGDTVRSGQIIAQVGNDILKTKEDGLVTGALDNVGKSVNPGEVVVTIINPNDLRVVAHVDEDKGLSDVKIGNQVVFTVDAFGDKKYDGVVDEISQTSRQSGVVFNISDQREVKQFDVKVRFDEKKYGELKNGMSTKVTIYTK